MYDAPDPADSAAADAIVIDALADATASDAATGRRAVEPIAPPAHAPPGERVAFEGLENLPPERSAHAAVALWEKCTPELSTDDGGVARYGGRALLASEGPCTSRITGKIG